MRSFLNGYEGQNPAKRGFAGVMTVALHGLAAVLLLMISTASKPVETRPAVTTFDVEQPGPPSLEPPKPKQVETPPQPPEPVIVPVAQIILPTDNFIPVSTVEQVASEASGGGCNLTGTVQLALRADEQVTLDLPTIPTDRRSVANALALWNVAWVEPDGQLPEAALVSIVNTVQRTVAAASDTCRLQVQRGPRLIYLPGVGKTTVLALGSGEWTWQQVAESSPFEPSESDFILAGANRAPPAKISKQLGREKLDLLVTNIFGR